MSPLKVVLLDPEVKLLAALEAELLAEGYQVWLARSAGEGLQILAREAPVAAVVAALDLPDGNGLELIREIKGRWPETGILSLAGQPSGSRSPRPLEAIRLGAYQWFERGCAPEEVLIHLSRLRRQKGLESALERLQGPDPPPERLQRGLVGNHPSLLEVLRTVDGLSRLRTTVLILGESGTGKELVARAIHQRSPQAAEPFLGVNCGAFSRGLLEDQLFGHRRGAFTGAVEDQAGLLVSAGRGTLFLDEIAEMDLDLQGRLLRAIQEREVVPLGTHRPVPWQARLIAATNRELESLAASGEFRKDLFYRLNVVQVRIPPLRERLEDVPVLADHFLGELQRESGRTRRLSAETLELLVRHPYPGNVRELKNALERAHALSRSEEIQPQDLPAEFRSPSKEGFRPLADVEKEHILQALRLAGGRRNLAARFLRIDRNRLSRLMKRHGIEGAAPEENGLN
jgi:DNA-binding NtrC family response regulator